MNKKQTPSQKKRAATVAAVLCFVAAIAIVGTYTLSGYKQVQQREELARAEEEAKEKQEQMETEAAEETGSTQIDNQNEGSTVQIQEETSESGQDTSGNGDSSTDQNGGAADTQAAAGKGDSLNFQENSQLLMPVDGTVLMSFSMDKTVYFSTLEQYKYNPAMIISAAENDQVIAGTTGIVKSIDVTAQTGTTVNLDLGNGYELFYGQLKEVPVKAGDYVEANTVIGYVSQPTKYYSVEGPNLYFEMRKDGQPVNPVDYIGDGEF